MGAPQQQFIVVLRNHKTALLSYAGPYRKFHEAEGDAQAWCVRGVSTWVEPLLTPEQAMKGTLS